MLDIDGYSNSQKDGCKILVGYLCFAVPSFRGETENRQNDDFDGEDV